MSGEASKVTYGGSGLPWRCIWPAAQVTFLSWIADAGRLCRWQHLSQRVLCKQCGWTLQQEAAGPGGPCQQSAAASRHVSMFPTEADMEACPVQLALAEAAHASPCRHYAAGCCLRALIACQVPYMLHAIALLGLPLGTPPLRTSACSKDSFSVVPSIDAFKNYPSACFLKPSLQPCRLDCAACPLLAAFPGVCACASACSEENPFALPSDEEIFMLQEDEKRRRSEQIRAMRSLPVYMKSTFSSQIQATVARDAGTANAQRRPMGVDPVRYGATCMLRCGCYHSSLAALQYTQPG